MSLISKDKMKGSYDKGSMSNNQISRMGAKDSIELNVKGIYKRTSKEVEFFLTHIQLEEIHMEESGSHINEKIPPWHWFQMCM